MSVQTMRSMFASPIIFILGSTATGKSKLGIELAKRLNGEIISADSMQVYKGLEIITNKVSEEERAEVTHHLLDVITPPAEYSVSEFRCAALDIIQQLFCAHKLPVVVGGTNYYIEALLWNFLMDDTSSPDMLQTRKELGSNKRAKLDGDTFEQLNSVDPERAAELHPNDTRKIARSLQVFRTTGKKHSELLKEQRQQPGASPLGGPLRFSKALIFWLTCDQSELDKRISERVDSMLSKGLDEEVTKFYENYKKTKERLGTDSALYQEGLFQAIGFKEFHDYFTCDDKEKKEAHLGEGLSALKRVTIKYSKKQRTWIQNRFLSRHGETTPDIYKLDATNLDTWMTDVLQKAVDVTRAFIANSEIPAAPVERRSVNLNAKTKFICETCDGRTIMGEASWKEHVSSKRHKYFMKKQLKEVPPS